MMMALRGKPVWFVWHVPVWHVFMVLVTALTLTLACGAAQADSVAPPEQRRGAEQTYLTFPEWYLVHSPAEYASYLAADRRPSDFPFWGHIGQLWSSYGHVTRATRDQPFNIGYHVMIVVIASSTTVEYALRSVYEVTIGRLFELTRMHGPTSEERYAAKTAQDYVDFIRVQPWYEFDFSARLKAVWAETGSSGPDGLRKWERKYALSTEYGVKALYAILIKKLTRAAYDAPRPTTAVLVDRWVDRLDGNWPEMQRVRSFPNGGELVLLPRYEAFKTVAIAIARSGANFAEVAGNGPDARILISVIVPREWRPDSEGSASLFEQPILTMPEEKRVALTVPVRQLAQTLRELDGMQITVEHVYDY
ncbi:MAG: hypothetical protein JWL63_117 [Rhodocyclales bacterium]|nr:hypothetical protein [Rhodocyclales bacterium]